MSGVGLAEQRVRLSLGLPHQPAQAHGPAHMECVTKPLHSPNDSGFQSSGFELFGKLPSTSQSLPLSIEFGQAGSQIARMSPAANIATVHGKTFAVAPMVDGADNSKKTIGQKASCAQRVQ